MTPVRDLLVIFLIRVRILIGSILLKIVYNKRPIYGGTISNGMKNFTSNSQKIGELGEDVACKYLIKHGFSVLERNYTKKWGEIDIIAQKDNKRYFIEVKSVSCETLPDFSDENPFIKRPEENMHPSKMARLRRVVETYLISNRKGNLDWRFDLLLVYLDLKQKKARVKKMENIIL